MPPEALRPSAENSDYHVGRGGAGNEHLAPGHGKKATAGTAAAPRGLADKLKAKLTSIFKK